MKIFIRKIIIFIILSTSFIPVYASDFKLVNKFVELGFNPGLPVFYRTDGTKIRKIFGEPVKVEKFTYPDDREPQSKNIEIIYYYSGVKITVFGPENSNILSINELVLTSNKYKLVGGLNIGKKLSTFKKVLGNPSGSNGSIIFYRNKNKNNEYVQYPDMAVTIECGETNTVESITWTSINEGH